MYVCRYVRCPSQAFTLSCLHKRCYCHGRFPLNLWYKEMSSSTSTWLQFWSGAPLHCHQPSFGHWHRPGFKQSDRRSMSPVFSSSHHQLPGNVQPDFTRFLLCLNIAFNCAAFSSIANCVWNDKAMDSVLCKNFTIWSTYESDLPCRQCLPRPHGPEVQS